MRFIIKNKIKHRLDSNVNIEIIIVMIIDINIDKIRQILHNV
jgi:hypothetical protein